MSWGELTCEHLYNDDKPCKPTIITCNKQCPHYKTNAVMQDVKPLSKTKMDLIGDLVRDVEI